MNKELGIMKLVNTLTGKKEKFEPIHEKEVGMYNCGPTVYNYAHIGNLRAYVFADTLRRALEYSGFKVNQVINITDIGHLSGDGDEGEDKMTKALKREGKPFTLEAMRELANFYFKAFKEDLNKLNIKEPDHFPFASDHIKEDVSLIEKLTEKDFAYKTSDGIYFDISKDKNYGRLGRQNFSQENLGDQYSVSRIGTNPEKRNPRDFALWKFNSELGFEAPFGKGFPGWHIECSAMSMKYLGETFDIHTGGTDHIPVHHNNEIAQSENATGKEFARFWLHSAFVNMGEEKMAKSEGNTLTLKDLEEKGIHPLAYRFWLLQAKYSSPINFSWEAVKSAQISYLKILRHWGLLQITITPTTLDADFEGYQKRFRQTIEDDLNTPQAIALIWEILENDNLNNFYKKQLIADFDKVLGLKIESMEAYVDLKKIPEEVRKMIEERESARKEKDWEKSDKIREELKSKGYEIEDTPEGVRVSKI